ncbi:MAG TPA: T9SS type A sorting domain-containing protein [Bacteroidia bacterium]|nr:T9SS type A sorting domain-containing protein [Bacteroidia bacterium]
MKKIFVSLFLLIISVVAVGQSIHILSNNKDVTNTTVVIPITKGEGALADLSLLNTTANHLPYQVSRTILNPPFDECGSLFFCTGKQCYAPSSSLNWTRPYPDTIRANEKLPGDSGTTGLAAHYDVCPTTCSDLKVLYRVYLTDPNVKDTAYVTIVYSCATGIAEENASFGSLSDAYPNPSRNGFSVNYTLLFSEKSELIVYDLYGKRWIEVPLQKNEGSIHLNTTSLSAGVYFYCLIVNGQRAATKQVVVD